MATIPWFPGAGLLSKWSSAGKLARGAAPRDDRRASTSRIRARCSCRGSRTRRGARSTRRRSRRALARYRGKVDVVLGSWAYPDGFAAVIAARSLGVPCVVKLHGCDINIIAKDPGPRRMIGVGAAASGARRRGQPRARRRGRRARRRPRARRDRDERRRRRAVSSARSCGRARRARACPPGRSRSTSATSRPRRACSISARRGRPSCATFRMRRSLVVGGGPLQGRARGAAKPLGERVRLVGPQPLETIPTWHGRVRHPRAAEPREGTPNVVLEALASGRRVVATAVGGIPDLITSPTLGALVPPRDPDALADALVHAFATPYARRGRAARRPRWVGSKRCGAPRGAVGRGWC